VAQGLPPFDRPTLNAELAPNPALFGSGTAGSGGFVPVMVAPIPPVIGAQHFGIGIAHALGGSIALLAIATSQAPSGTTLGPLPVYVAPDPLPILLPMPLSGAPLAAGAGLGSFMTPVPDSAALSGSSFVCQWIVADAGAGSGYTVTPGVGFTFFAP
jgi:hypothetical protein